MQGPVSQKVDLINENEKNNEHTQLLNMTLNVSEINDHQVLIHQHTYLLKYTFNDENDN